MCSACWVIGYFQNKHVLWITEIAEFPLSNFPRSAIDLFLCSFRNRTRRVVRNVMEVAIVKRGEEIFLAISDVQISLLTELTDVTRSIEAITIQSFGC